MFCGSHALLKVPWEGRWLTISGGWLNLASSAGAPVYQSPRHQNPEFFEIVEPLLETLPAGCIVDVGANIGIYTLNFRRRIKTQIISFEPSPFVFSLLSENVRSNNLPSVIVKNLACGDSRGHLLFNSGINGNVVCGALIAPVAANLGGKLGPVNQSENNNIISVSVVRLDDELRDIDVVSLIKIDCEGYECNVLIGCRKIIETKRPVLFIELHPKFIGNFNHTLSEICDLLRPYYRLELWDADPAQRSSSRLIRFLGRYRRVLVKLRDEAQMLELAREEPTPDQLFLLALPREHLADRVGTAE
jgi:FkbM family methyltransferase